MNTLLKWGSFTLIVLFLEMLKNSSVKENIEVFRNILFFEIKINKYLTYMFPSLPRY
jgi:hypothetical protein